jgi:(E)-4-hydroxy-3-methylbut-2-enyl-diphosphate synthase
MIYAAGKTDHTIDGGDMVNHIVGLVEKKAAQIEHQKMLEKQAAE